MWFTWSSGAGRPFGAFLSEILFPRTTGMGTCCRSSDRRRPMFALSRWHMVRAMLPHRAVFPAGERSRSKSRLPGRSLLPSTTLSAFPQLGPRGPSTGPRIKTFVSMCATLLTLAPTFPTLPGPCDPAAKPGFLSWGCPKIAPPSFKSKSPSPGRARRRVSAASSRFLRDGKAVSHPRSVHVVSRHLDGLLLLDPAALFHAAADPGVHRVSFRRETEFPAMHLPPFEAFPPPTATVSGTNPGPRWPASPPQSFPVACFQPPVPGCCVHREPCLLALFLPSFLGYGYPCLVWMEAGASRPCSIVGSVARSTVSSRACPVLPWACPIRLLACSVSVRPPASGRPARVQRARIRTGFTSKTTPRSGSSV